MCEKPCFDVPAGRDGGILAKWAKPTCTAVPYLRWGENVGTSRPALRRRSSTQVSKPSMRRASAHALATLT
jgi:hypothetical protein